MEQTLDLKSSKVVMKLDSNQKVVSVKMDGEELFFPKQLFSDSGFRYSDGVISIVTKIILHNLRVARQEYQIQKSRLTGADGNGINDTSPTFKILEEGQETMSKEEIGKLATRQRLLIEKLEAALIRAKTKTIGCGKFGLISLERLCCVPHTTRETFEKN